MITNFDNHTKKKKKKKFAPYHKAKYMIKSFTYNPTIKNEKKDILNA